VRLPEDEARRRFADSPVARLATVTPAGLPHVVPVTFAADGDLVYTVVDAKPKTTSHLQRLRNIAAQPQVALLADHYEPDWDALWWVRIDGRASILSEPAAMAPALALLTARYPRYRRQPPGGPVICVRAGRWTGWAAAAPDG
jgi:PPOX class probable F420-dependent enzyme